MLSVFFFLVLMAVIFFFLGFFFDAFYFRGATDIRLSQEAGELRRALEGKNQEVIAAREEAAMTVRNHEQQIRQRYEEAGYVHRFADRGEQQLLLAQKEGESVSATAAVSRQFLPNEQPILALASELAEPAKPQETGQSQAGFDNDVDVPAWRENLSNILNILDKIEKKIEK